MIEVFGNLDKLNTKLRFTYVIFRSDFISSSRTSSRLTMFSVFFYLKACEESGWSIVVAGQVGRDLKSNVSGFINSPHMTSEWIIHF